MNPPVGSYLATRWNVARSEWLVRAPQDLWGYVAAERATIASYTPDARRQRNSTNAANSVVCTATGAYQVTFPNLGVTGGTVNVTAMGSSYRNCKVNDWGHRLADQPSSANYTPVLSEQFNSGGGPLEVVRSWPAWYSVRIPGFEDLGGNVQVTALSFSGDSARCQLNNWSTSWSSTRGPATNVSVRCFDATGAAVDAPFTMSYVR